MKSVKFTKNLKNSLVAALISVSMLGATATVTFAQSSNALTASAEILILGDFPSGGSKLSDLVRDLLIQDAKNAAPILASLAEANALQSRAIGFGFAEAVRELSEDPNRTNDTQSVLEVVAATESPIFEAAFSGSADDIQTASLGENAGSERVGTPVISRFSISDGDGTNRGTGESVGEPFSPVFGDIIISAASSSSNRTSSVSPVTP